MELYFYKPNITKYLVPSQSSINPFALSKLIRDGFGSIKGLYETS